MLTHHGELIDELLLAPQALGAGPLRPALDQNLETLELDVALGEVRRLSFPLVLEPAEFGVHGRRPAMHAAQIGRQPSVAVGEPAGGASLPLSRLAQSGKLIAQRGDRLVRRNQAVARLVQALAGKAREHRERVHGVRR
jgi:hypothetical protein